MKLNVVSVSAERRSCHGGMMTAAGWVVAVDKLIETGQIQISDCDANFAVGMSPFCFSAHRHDNTISIFLHPSIGMDCCDEREHVCLFVCLFVWLHA